MFSSGFFMALDALLTRDDVFNGVRTVLMEALSVDEEEVTEDVTIYRGLGAESIDGLDITFRLERRYNLKLPYAEIPIGRIWEGLEEGTHYTSDGLGSYRLTQVGLQTLAKSHPYISIEGLTGEFVNAEEYGNRVTVGSLVDYVHGKLVAAQRAE